VPWVIGSGGVVVDVTSDEAIEAAMRKILSDSVARQRYAMAAKARAESFSAIQVASTYEAHYTKTLQRKIDLHPSAETATWPDTGRI
jgi:hypothetical protein